MMPIAPPKKQKNNIHHEKSLSQFPPLIKGGYCYKGVIKGGCGYKGVIGLRVDVAIRGLLGY